MISKNECIVIGAGGHAKVIVDILQISGYSVVACLSKELLTDDQVLGVPIHVGDEQLSRFYNQGVKLAFIAVGDNTERLRLGQITEEVGYNLVNAISPHAYVAASVALGRGIAVMAGAVINPQASISDYAIINTGARVDHDCRIGKATHIAPGSTLCGNVTVDDKVWIGAGCTIIENQSIGFNSYIGAGSVVVKSIPAQSLAYGVPAQVIRSLK